MVSGTVLLTSLVYCCAASPNGLGRTPPLGWSTWMTCGDAECTHDYCDENMIKEAATALTTTGLQKLNYSYVLLDDCWASPDRDPTTNALTWDAERFPSGIPALAKWLGARGFKLGIYTSAGNQTCSSGGRPRPIPGSRDHYTEDARAFATWNVSYVKYDWCGDIHDELLQGRRAHTEFYAAMNATGRAMYLEVVAGYWFLGNKISDYANAWRFCEDHHDNWNSTRENLGCRNLLVDGTHGAPGGWAHMDGIMTGGAGCVPFAKGAHCPGQTDTQYKTSFVLWGLAQSPLIVMTDVRNMTAIMNATLFNTELLAAHQSTATPPGGRLAYWHCTEPLACQVWGRKMTPDGGEWIVALANVGTVGHNITAKVPQLLGWGEDTSYTVRDIWEHKDLQPASGDITLNVPAGDLSVFKLVRQ